jgi:putative transposase
MILGKGVEHASVRLYTYILMPNHWHFVVEPREDGALSGLMHWVTTTHARRWQLHRGLQGEGAVYQGRYKAIPVQSDRHFLWVCRYVERNAARASLVSHAEDWRWSALWRRCNGVDTPWLDEWRVSRPDNWLTFVNEPQTQAELDAFRRSVARGRPFGDAAWAAEVAARLGFRSPRRAR